MESSTAQIRIHHLATIAMLLLRYVDTSDLATSGYFLQVTISCCMCLCVDVDKHSLVLYKQAAIEFYSVMH